MTYNITKNSVFNSLEIKFSQKPPVTVLEALKALHFRWHRAKALWYGYAEETAVRKALGENVIEAPKATAKTATESTAKKIKYYKAIFDLKGNKTFVEAYGELREIKLADNTIQCACEFARGEGWKITDIATGASMQRGCLKNKKELDEYCNSEMLAEAINRLVNTEYYKKLTLDLAEFKKSI